MQNQTHQLVEKPETSLYSSVVKSLKRNWADWYKQGYKKNGVYEIMVLREMEGDGGGWIVFQRRFDGSVSFARTWNEYRTVIDNYISLTHFVWGLKR